MKQLSRCINKHWYRFFKKRIAKCVNLGYFRKKNKIVFLHFFFNYVETQIFTLICNYLYQDYSIFYTTKKTLYFSAIFRLLIFVYNKHAHENNPQSLEIKNSIFRLLWHIYSIILFNRINFNLHICAFSLNQYDIYLHEIFSGERRIGKIFNWK